MSKPVILTGLRANNDLHIGNYLGALLPIVDMAQQKAGEYQVNLFVPDLHSFTTPIDHGTLLEATMNNLRVYAAAGLPLDNPDVHVYRQSYIPAHSELTWILDCFTGMGELERMTQFKEKSSKVSNLELSVIKQIASGSHGFEVKVTDTPYNPDFVIKDEKGNYLNIELKVHRNTGPSVGLFNYPVLMTADILLYGASYVPIGDDQTQHLEFARDISERMNKRFETELFIVPKPVKEQHTFFGKDQGLRIKDLVDPSKKMSKSDESGKGVIFLTDSPEAATKKIMSATTDSRGKVNYDYANQPGISNLLDILRFFGGNPGEFIGNDQYGPLKTATAKAVSAFLTDFQTNLANVDNTALSAKLESDEQLMNEQATARLLKVHKAVGLR